MNTQRAIKNSVPEKKSVSAQVTGPAPQAPKKAGHPEPPAKIRPVEIKGYTAFRIHANKAIP